MKESKTTIFGGIASIAGSAATVTTGPVQLVLSIIAGLFGSIFAYQAKDRGGNQNR